MTTFAQALTRALQLTGKTKRDLASVWGISEAYAGRIVNGRQPCSEARLIAAAQAFDLKPWQLLALVDR